MTTQKTEIPEDGNGETPPEAKHQDAARPEAAETTGDASAETIAKLEAEVAELKDKMLRALSDAENARRIAAREKADASKYAIANFARDMVGVGDNLRRALDSVGAEERAASEVLNNLCVGVEMTEREMLGAFERNAILRVASEGKPFDHNVHEALSQIPNPDVPEGTVVQEVRSGYTIAGRLLRPAQVLVATGGAKAAPAPHAESPADGQKAYPDVAPAKADEKGGKIDEEL
ncbi:nucleotide exchange factor GrpE [Varunaivibrio sulfuroxidans]|uniref:Protein GrpE n=1 Tax=Varunaivibrio sulfuroxidans TaxID=1773489 RepID=A0A4R3JJ80_9PROT|nr:nucleotide exchange factor GrpE [Varunaivibrio sulfuroxidans]TCS64910.1 molecular chaperone GrpE [Varunaivibrio sulfuroxidans]WES29796.1 nucleotide exchange factor GrpE [Varunaivibrio sulfuroxidans]